MTDRKIAGTLISIALSLLVLGGVIGEEIGERVGYNKGLKAPHSVVSQAVENEVKAEAAIRQRIELLLTAQSIIMCESSARHDGVWGDKNHKYPAYGIGQFQKRTFYYLAGLSEIKSLNWKKANDQLRLLLWAIDNGYAGLWTCYRRV